MRCGEYNASTFTASDVWLFLAPCLLWALISLGLWRVTAIRVGSIVCLGLWLWASGDIAISQEISGYTACDRKGDEAGQGLAFAAISLVPAVWAVVSLMTALAIPAFRVLTNRR